MSSTAVDRPEGQDVLTVEGGDRHSKKLAFLRSLSSAAGSSKPAGGPNKLSMLYSPGPTDMAAMMGKTSNGSAIRPRSAGLSRGKRKVRKIETNPRRPYMHADGNWNICHRSGGGIAGSCRDW